MFYFYFNIMISYSSGNHRKSLLLKQCLIYHAFFHSECFKLHLIAKTKTDQYSLRCEDQYDYYYAILCKQSNSHKALRCFL
jgi:hypothetical protein